MALPASPVADLAGVLTSSKDALQRLYDVVAQAKQELWLVSPYITFDRVNVLQRELRAALARGVSVKMVMRNEQKVTQEFLASAGELMAAGLQAFAVDWLHAKLYLSESCVLLTSLNLVDSSFTNSIEGGFWATNPRFVDQAKRFIAAEIAPNLKPLMALQASTEAAPAQPRQEAEGPSGRDPSERQTGYCIRCGMDIPLDPSHPYCEAHFQEWAKYRNRDYRDRYCHSCGSSHPATMRKPVCRTCYYRRTETIF